MARISADERRHELINAAIRVMARDGVGKTTTRAIAAEAKMPTGFVHYCFGTKDELLMRVLTAIGERNVLTAIDDTALKPRATLYKTLRASVRGYWRGVERDPIEQRLHHELTQYALREPRLAESIKEQHERRIADASTLLHAAARVCRVEWTAPVGALARLLCATIDGTTLAWLVDPQRSRPIAVLDQLVAHLAHCTRPA